MNFELWYFPAARDWFSEWGMIYPGVWVLALFWVFVFGACIGSFLNVCIWRIPRGESLSKAASHCTVCGHPIRWYDNIPVASYLILRGRCRHCRTPYSPSYFFVELFCGALCALLVVKTGLMRQSAAVIPARMLLIFFAVSCGLTDIRSRIVPDKLTFAGMIFALLAAAACPSAWGTDRVGQALFSSLLSGAVAGVILALFAVVGMVVSKREILGMGDVKFIAMCAMLIGLPGTFFTLLAASLAGTVWGLAVKRRLAASLPFVPFLAAAALVWIFADRYILDVFLSLSSKL